MAATWTNIGSIRSESSKGTRYGIDINEAGDIRCHCAAFIHSKDQPKTCKHIESEEFGELLRSYQAMKRPRTKLMAPLARTIVDFGYCPRVFVGYTIPSQTPLAVVKAKHVDLADGLYEAARDFLDAPWAGARMDRLRSALRAIQFNA